MRKFSVSAAVLALLLHAASGAAQDQDAKAALARATAAMGVQDLRTIEYSGEGFTFVFGQSATPGGPWSRFSAKNYVRDIDLTAPASHVQLVRTAVDKRGGGGVGLPIVNQTQNQFILPGAPWAQQVDIWLTPFGFLKAAGAAPNATAAARTVSGTKYTVVTFTSQNKYTVNGYISESGMVERVETWLEHPALGDMLLDANFADYRDFGGVRVPTRIVQEQGGFPVLDLTVTDAKPNAAITIDAPQRGAGGGVNLTAPVRAIKAADGVFLLNGGPNNSVAVEFKDYMVVIEAPMTEERSQAFIAEAKRQIPNKPIRYLINTHHHFDHSGGMRTFAAEGATIVTHEVNKPYYERALTGPRTLAPDALALSGKAMTFETLTEKKVITDGTRSIEVHLVKGTTHADGMVMAYLPNEKLLVEGDIYDMPGPGVPAPTEGTATAANLLDNIERLKLDVDRLLPVHSPDIVPIAELYKAAGRTRAAR